MASQQKQGLQKSTIQQRSRNILHFLRNKDVQHNLILQLWACKASYSAQKQTTAKGGSRIF